MTSEKKTSVLIWSGVAASVAGIVAVVACMRCQERSKGAGDTEDTHYRDVKEVLSDVHAKIEEIERQLPAPTAASNGRTKQSSK